MERMDWAYRRQPSHVADGLTWELQADLERIRQLLLQRRGAIVNVTADESGLAAAESGIQSFLQSLPESGAADADWSGRLPMVNEAITVPTQVCGTFNTLGLN